MIKIKSLSESPTTKVGTLTIGNFDGVHLGHQHILKKCHEHGPICVLTFENHPKEVLQPENPVLLLTTNKEKLHLLEEAGVDFVLSIPFTKAFSQQSGEDFIRAVQESVPFDRLVLGPHARFGKGRSTDPASLALKLGYLFTPVSPLTIGEKQVSSSLIRSLLQVGDLSTVAQLLGRPYQIVGPVVSGLGKGKQIGFPTANISLEHLCTPPFGVYTIDAHCEGICYRGIANLGVAPTIRNDPLPYLEAHLFHDTPLHLHGKYLRITLKKFLRKEKRFENVAALKAQLNYDISLAK